MGRVCGLALWCLAFIWQAQEPAAAAPKTELALFKEPLYAIAPRGRMGRCNGLFYVEPNKDHANLAGFRYHLCSGIYSLTLDGPPGVTVTLFGRDAFKTDWGFLILRKKDEKRVWLPNLEKYPDRTWHSEKADDDYGAFEVFYQAHPNFAQNVASIKWGEWWDVLDLPPALKNQ